MGTRIESVAELLNPTSIALVGASEESMWASGIVHNLRSSGFSGALHMVHPTHQEQFGQVCYPSVLDIPAPVNHAVILVNASRVMQILGECANKGIRGATLLTSGFKESGPEGAKLQEELTRFCREHDIAAVGPNCLGFINYKTAATLATTFPFTVPPISGHIGFVVHSGSMMVNMHSMAETRGIGYSWLISAGNEAVVSASDYFRHMVEDPETRVIGGLLEEIRNPKAFAQVCRRAMDLGKPVVLIKIGRSEIAARSVIAHTGSLAGHDNVVDAFLKQLGVIRVTTPEELLETAALLSANGWPKGRRLAVTSTSGGACSLFANLAHNTSVELPTFSSALQEKLSSVLHMQYGTPQNPLDLTGQVMSDANMIPNAVETLMRDPDLDGVVMITQPIRYADPMKAWRVASQRQIAKALTACDKFSCAMSQVSQDLTEIGREVSKEVGIHYVSGEGRGIYALDKAIRYGEARTRYLADRDAPTVSSFEPDRAAVEALLAGRSGALNEAESKTLLKAYGITTPREAVAADAEAAVRAAADIGYPVVLKILAANVPHKTEAGGVMLNLGSPEAVRTAYDQIVTSVRKYKPDANIAGVLVAEQVQGAHELLAGIKVDPAFGPVVVAGLGGIYSEILKDIATALPPRNRDDALALLGELRGRAILDSTGGFPAADVDSVAETLIRLGHLAVDLQDRISELDINPLLVLPAGKGVRAADALVVLKAAETNPRS